MNRRGTWWVVVALLVTLACWTRFAELGTRSFHHDEAVHAWIAHDLARGAGYHYDPTYHGPLLYHLEAIVFRVAGAGDVQARAVAAACGAALVVLLAVLLRPMFGGPVAVVAATLALASPALTYYSRFDSHDALILVFTLLMPAALVRYRSTGLIWFAVAASLAICTKLNAYFVIGALGSYAMLRVAYGRVRERPSGAIELLVRDPYYVAIALTTGAIVLALLSVTSAIHLYRAGGRSVISAAGGAWLSLLGDGFAYWWSAHQGGRLGGPFYFYLPILAIYEPVVLAGSLAALAWYMRRRAAFLAALAGVWAFESVAVASIQASLGNPDVLHGARYVQLPALLLASAWLLAGVWTTISLWEDRRELLACWVWLVVTQVVLYSYANEKVPWLVVHLLLPGIVVTACLLIDAWNAAGSRRRRLVVVGVVLLLEGVSLRASWIVNTRNRSNLAEPLLQVDYTEDVDRVVQIVAAQAARSPERPVAIVEGAAQWPFGWYLRDFDVRYTSDAIGAPASAPILVRAARPGRGSPGPGYARQALRYYAWTTWIRNVERGDIRGLTHFLLYHDRWGQAAGVAFELWLRSDVAARLAATPDSRLSLRVAALD